MGGVGAMACEVFFLVRERSLKSLPLLEDMLSSLSWDVRKRGRKMANLVVRNLDQRIVDALKQRAARRGRSAEAEHRAILEEVLLAKPKKRSLAEALASMPNVGQDEDFERREDVADGAHVFD
jgi:plasmid stability protein